MLSVEGFFNCAKQGINRRCPCSPPFRPTHDTTMETNYFHAHTPARDRIRQHGRLKCFKLTSAELARTNSGWRAWCKQAGPADLLLDSDKPQPGRTGNSPESIACGSALPPRRRIVARPTGAAPFANARQAHAAKVAILKAAQGARDAMGVHHGQRHVSYHVVQT